jgi:hypothetical protein
LEDEQIAYHIAIRLGITEWLSWQALHAAEHLSVPLQATPLVETSHMRAEELWLGLDKAGHVLEGTTSQSGLSQVTRCKVCLLTSRSPRLEAWMHIPCLPMGVLSPSGRLLQTFGCEAGIDETAETEVEKPIDYALGTLVSTQAAVIARRSHIAEAISIDKGMRSRAHARVQEAIHAQSCLVVEDEHNQWIGHDAPAGSCTIPAWARAMHASHELCIAGGAIFCTACGHMATTSRKGALLGVCAKPAQAASSSRLKSLRLGSASGVSEWSRWPDGICKKATRPVFRLLRRDDE